ncbi:MAG: hypothetical protein HFF44_06385 [Lawsonibacter sp.]|nr:hypothetical protein [Lawsonibacter sp.]
MSTPLSFCDISARYGQTPAPQQTIEEQTGWNPKQLFLDYMRKVQDQREKNAKEAEEDALMAMVDAMNASEEDKGRTEQTLTDSLAKAGKAIVDQNTELMPDGTKRVTWVDPTATLTVQVLLSCLGDRFNLEQADKIQENQEQAKEDREERLEVTEQRDPSETSAPNFIEKEV